MGSVIPHKKFHTTLAICLCAFLLAGTRFSYAQSPAESPFYQLTPRIESVGVGEIPRGVVATMAQDKAGFLWLSTGDGLMRYDGYRYRAQEFDSPDVTQRNLGWIRALLPTRDGRLWIGTETRGLAVYDPTDDIVQFPVPPVDTATNDPAMPEPTVRALAEDVDGAIWAGTIGGGLKRFDPRTKELSTFLHDGEPGCLPDERVLSLLVDRRGNLWVGTWLGLSLKRRGRDDFEPIASPGNSSHRVGTEFTVQALMESSDGHIWLGTKQGDVAQIDPQSGAIVPLSAIAPDSAFPEGAVSSFVELPGGKVWVGRSTGIDVYDSQSGKRIQSLRYDPRSTEGLAANEVTTLVRDHAGWIWIGGFGLGLQRHDPNNVSFWVRGMDADDASPMAQPDLRGLVQLNNGEVWASTHTAGVAILSSGLATVGAVRPRIPEPGSSASPSVAPRELLSVNAITQSSDGSVWIASGEWLFQFDDDRRQLNAIPLHGGVTHRLVPGQDGVVWVCTQNGLYRLDPARESLQAIHKADGTPFMGDVFTVAPGPDQHLWVGTVKGLYRMKPHDDTFEAVQSAEGAGLGNPVVIGLLWVADKTLWLDTAVAGLHHMLSWDGKLARFDRVSQRHGIVSKPFGANLLQDSRGRIWTQQYVYDPLTNHLTELTAADGVDIGTPWFFSFAKTQDGRFLFGGSKGLLVVEPENFSTSSNAPPIVLTRLRIDNIPETLGRLATGLTIAPDEQGFSVEFAALDYTAPSRLRYAYQLVGADETWIMSGADLRTASYGNLNPGHSTLKVRATNHQGVWNPQVLELPVTVLPAWWETWWFRLSALLALAGLLYATIQLRTRDLKRRQLELEHKVDERTAALNVASLTDPLTGMNNRRYLSTRIKSDTDLAVRRYQSHARNSAELPADSDLIFFLIDIDHFKHVNDVLGHAAGDAVLMQMRERFAAVFRETDYMVRWGGEEFLIVARATSRDHASDLAERARQAVGTRPFELPDGQEILKTCSIGFACFPLCTQAPATLSWSETVMLADKALYCVKQRGRDGWMGLKHAGELSPDAVRSLLLASDFSSASGLAMEQSQRSASSPKSAEKNQRDPENQRFPRSQE